MNKPRLCALLAVAVTLGGCEFAQKAVAPSVTGQAPTAVQPAPIVPLDAAKFGTPSGTSVGGRITQFRADLAQLQQAAVEEVQRGRQLQTDTEASVASYQITVGTMKAGQQGAAAPDAGAWQRAQAQLRAISANLDQMNALAAEVAKNVAYAAYLRQSIGDANTAADATEEDRRQLITLQDAATQTSASLDQLLDGLQQEILSQSHFLGQEGANLAHIAPAGATAAPGAPAQQSAPPAAPGAAGAGLAGGRPFVVIRFDNPSVDYEQQLHEAVNAALARRPDVAFDLVAAAPAGATPEEAAQNAETARVDADKVMRSLLGMGVRGDRISLSQVADPSLQNNEVRLYVR
jgi:hypothetical protein